MAWRGDAQTWPLNGLCAVGRVEKRLELAEAKLAKYVYRCPDYPRCDCKPKEVQACTIGTGGPKEDNDHGNETKTKNTPEQS